MAGRRCIECGSAKPFSEFDRKTANRYHPRCRPCRRKVRDYRAEYESRRVRDRLETWRREGRLVMFAEAMKTRVRWREFEERAERAIHGRPRTEPGTCRSCGATQEAGAEFYESSPTECVECARERSRRRYERNREREKMRVRQYKYANPDKVRRWGQRRWERMAAQDVGTVDEAFVEALLTASRRCHWCRRRIRRLSDRTIDHVVPLRKGGKHCRSNLCVACRKCNSSKGARTPDEWTANDQLAFAV